MTLQPLRILIIDDDADIRATLRVLLRPEGFLIFEAEDGPSALNLIESDSFDLLITDIRLPPPMDGIETVRRARASLPHLRSLFISGRDNARWDDPDRDDFISKPFNGRELIGCIWELYSRHVSIA